MNGDIIIRGASEHNLKNINVRIPRNSLTVVTGLSGSGKSSLAFDTLYAEGQRRYVESLSAYARQFLDRMQKPKVEHIEGLSPAIAIEQRSAGSNPRSTVATVTEIYDYLRLLYAHTGIPHCPKCGKELAAQSAEAICEKILAIPAGKKMMILAPYITGRKGELRDVIDKIRRDGFVRARIDGHIVELTDEMKPLAKTLRHDIEAVVDRLVTGSLERSRLNDSVETALKCGGGELIVVLEETAHDNTRSWKDERISERLACVDCGVSFGSMEPRNFSFNSPFGACPHCNGLGSMLVMDPKLAVDYTKSLRNGAIPGWRRGPRHLIMYYNHLLRSIAAHLNMPEMMTTPFGKLPDEVQHLLLYGSGENPIDFSYYLRHKKYNMVKPFEGILANMQKRQAESESDSVRERLSEYMTRCECPVCHGARLKPESLAVTVGGLSIDKFNALSVENAQAFIAGLELDEERRAIAHDIVREIHSRLSFLVDVGLPYLTLNRESGTLSGGEAQRIRLATQVGSKLVNVLYILDEPSIGLHQRDNRRLIRSLEELRDAGNSVIVVEHDEDMMRAADFIVDVGPRAGRKGGHIMAAGTIDDILRSDSITADYLTGRRRIGIPETLRKGTGQCIVIRGARGNNLKNVTAEFPLGKFICVTGVSGSGKSTLVNETLRPILARELYRSFDQPLEYDGAEGLEHIDKLVVVDQSPIGRTPRSNPATYSNVFSDIRKLFEMTPDAQIRGFKAGRFSFNVKGGRCEECRGAGVQTIEMNFLPDVYVRCKACGGHRYNRETLEVKYKGKNIDDVLNMTVNMAVEFFENIPNIYQKLRAIQEVGLGYLTLGQPCTTLSGGESQRIKLSSELSKRDTGRTLYILDEPTTGLHFEDIRLLLDVLNKLVDRGNTVIVIEHNLDVIKVADHIIDIGPEGGAAGGEIIVAGTPHEVAQCEGSYTGQFLKKLGL